MTLDQTSAFPVNKTRNYLEFLRDRKNRHSVERLFIIYVIQVRLLLNYVIQAKVFINCIIQAKLFINSVIQANDIIEALERQKVERDVVHILNILLSLEFYC